MCLYHQISQPKLGQIAHVGVVLKLSGPGFENCPRFVGVIDQNKIQQTFPNDCIFNEKHMFWLENICFC